MGVIGIMRKKITLLLVLSFFLILTNSAFPMGEAPTSPSIDKPEAELTKPVDVSPDVEQKKSLTVYITKTGSKYHRGRCSYLRYSSIPIDLNRAVEMGYTPCSRCKPPAPSVFPKYESKTKQAEQKEEIVYITKTGSKYHRFGCRYLRKSSIPITLKKAKEYGYTPCSVCW